MSITQAIEIIKKFRRGDTYIVNNRNERKILESAIRIIFEENAGIYIRKIEVKCDNV